MKTDNTVLELLKKIEQQRAEIAKIERPQWKTNLSFSFTEGGPPIQLQVVADVAKLLGIAAFIQSAEENYKRAAETLGVTDYPPFAWCGFPASDWLSDVKARIAKIQVATKIKNLAAFEARAKALISDEKRAELELQALQDEMGLT